MLFTPETIIQRRADALTADVAGELVLMSVEQGKYFGLDEVGTDIWHRIEQPIAVGRLCASLAVDYLADAATIERDVVALLERLSDNGLLEPT
jgi:hypothetical protein